MKKIVIVLFSVFFVFSPAYSKSEEKLDLKSQSFMDLGRYVETLEINEASEEEMKQEAFEETQENINDYIFEEEARLDIAKRYEENAVELNLNDIDDTAINTVNNENLFKLRINETKYNIEQNIKNENIIWDGSKSFSQAFFSDSRHMAPIPGVVNSQELTAEVSPGITASIGQSFLNDAIGTSVLFVRTNESTYNTGSVISYKGDKLNLAVGSFNSSYNHAASGGAILSTNEYNLPKSTGSLSFGGAYFSNEAQEDYKTTGGLFGEYKFKRLKLNAQIGQSKYSGSNYMDTSLYLIPEFRISNSLYLKTRFIRNVTQNTMQDELVLTYKPVKSKHNLEIELNASNQYSDTTTIKQRLKLSTKFRI